MENSSPRISIITPVYNPGDLFRACLESLEAQTIFDQLEIVLVDDGTADGSDALCDEFAAQHPGQVQVFHQSNRGQGAARNLAIEAARGEYLINIDSDDSILPEACERLLVEAEATGADLTWGDYTRKSLFKSPIAELAEEDLIPMARYMRVALGSGLFYISPCVQLVRTDFLRENGVTFPEGRIFEDQSWLLRLMLAGATIHRIDYPFYVYNILDHRSSTTVVTSKRLMDAITVIYSMIDDIEAADPTDDVREVAEAYVANSINVLAHTYICHAPRRIQELARMRMNGKYAYYSEQTHLLPRGARLLGSAFVRSQEAFEEELARINEAKRRAHEAEEAAAQAAANAETPSA